MNVDKRVNVNANARITGKSGKYVTIETVAIDRKNNDYTTSHNVKMSKGSNPDKLGYVHIEGAMDIDVDGVNYIEPSSMNFMADAPDDLKMNAWITAEAASNFIEPRAISPVGGDKKPFGVASVKVGNRFQRGIVFNQLIPLFRERLKAGALVKLAGRLQYRTYEAADQSEKTVCEIICDNNYTEVLRASTKKNPFSFSTDDVMAGFKKAEEA